MYRVMRVKCLSWAFSLFELLLVIAIIASMTVVSLPRLTAYVAQHRLRDSAESLVILLNVARSMALVDRRPMVVCGGSALSPCSNEWSAGQKVLDPVAQKIRYSRAGLAPGQQLRYVYGMVERDQPLTFNVNGFVDGGQGHFVLCQKNADSTGFRVVVNRAGRVYLKADPCV